MRTLLIALGNDLLSDDGVAHEVPRALTPHADIETRSLIQLTPEVAEEIAGYDLAVFIDADASAPEVIFEPVDEVPPAHALTHVSTPGEVVVFSRTLFGFSGRAILCRIPAADFSAGAGISKGASHAARLAASQLQALVAALSAEPGITRGAERFFPGIPESFRG